MAAANITLFLGNKDTAYEPILWILEALLVTAFSFQSTLLFKRRDLQPIMSHGPRMLFLNLLGSYGMLAIMIVIFVRMLRDDEESDDLFCSIYKWAVTLLYPTIIFSFLLRYYRLRFVFSGVKQSDDSATNVFHQTQPTRKSHMSENHILRILLVILLFLAFIRLISDWIFEDKNVMVVSDSCRRGDSMNDSMIFWVVEHCLELFAFLLVAVDSMRVVKRAEFSMTKEMSTLALIWTIITTVMIVLLVLRLKQRSTSYDSWYWRWNTACDISYVVVTAIVGTTVPIIQSYLRCDLSWYPLFGNCKVLRSLESILNNISSLQMFRSFLIKECTVENLLLWVEIEIFKDNSTVRHAQRIFNKYLNDDPVLEVTTVSDELKKMVFDRITNTGKLVEVSHIFDEVQKEIFEYMKRESYPRFLPSAESRMLLDILDHEEFLCQSLKDSGLM